MLKADAEGGAWSKDQDQDRASELEPETTTARQLMPPGRSHIQKSLPDSAGSAAQSQTGDQILVGLLVAGLDVVQKIAALADH